jgi:hypothetical protein
MTWAQRLKRVFNIDIETCCYVARPVSWMAGACCTYCVMS